MTRLTRLRIAWTAGVVVLAAAVLVVAVRADSPLVTLALVFLLLVPGRVQGYLYRDLFRGRRLLDARRYAEAIPPLERFLAQLAAQPWRTRLVWLSWPGYSTEPAAMAFTNLGAARLELGELDLAEPALRAAIAADPGTPLPWVNLGLVEARRGRGEAAAAAFAHAGRLGYRGGALDQAQQGVSGALARVEGRGPAPDSAH